MSLFYQQPEILYPGREPRLPVPSAQRQVSTVRWYMGDTFPYLCKLWSILHDVNRPYQRTRRSSWGSRNSVPFAEYKFRELLAWSNSLPQYLSPRPQNAHHVQVMQ